jgi:hypothetical protein
MFSPLLLLATGRKFNARFAGHALRVRAALQFPVFQGAVK